MLEIKTKIISILNPDTGEYESIETLKGDKGDKGDIPTKGTDYWTEADQESIVQQVIAALGTPVFGRVDEENNIILTGELAAGEYVLKYEGADGNVVRFTLDSANFKYVSDTNVGYLRLSAQGIDDRSIIATEPIE